jgi:hypothetical protein
MIAAGNGGSYVLPIKVKNVRCILRGTIVPMSRHQIFVIKIEKSAVM